MRKGWLGNELPHPSKDRRIPPVHLEPFLSTSHRKIKFINVNVLFAKVRSVFAVTWVGGKQIHLSTRSLWDSSDIKEDLNASPSGFFCWDKVWAPSLLLWALGGGSKVTESLEKINFLVQLWCSFVPKWSEKRGAKKARWKWDEISGIYPQWAVAVKEGIPIKSDLEVIMGGGSWWFSWFWQQVHLFKGK